MMAHNMSTNEPEEKKENKLNKYSWLVLFILVAIRIAYQWQRSVLSYAYGYTGLDI